MHPKHKKDIRESGRITRANSRGSYRDAAFPGPQEIPIDSLGDSLV